MPNMEIDILWREHKHCKPKDVVYLDQQMHTCACAHMVENDKKTLEND